MPKCPTCGRLSGGPFTQAEFMAMHPELNVSDPDDDLPAELIEARDLAYDLKTEMDIARDANLSAEYAVSKLPSNDQSASALQKRRTAAQWAIEYPEVEERWRVANSAYHAMAQAHTEQKRAAEYIAGQMAQASRLEAEKAENRRIAGLPAKSERRGLLGRKLRAA